MDVPADLRGECLTVTAPAPVRAAWPGGILPPDAGRGAGFAARLDRLPCTRAALAAGAIDRAKAYVIADEVSCLDHAHATAVEAAVIARAPGQTTGQLRASARRAVLALRRRQTASTQQLRCNRYAITTARNPKVLTINRSLSGFSRSKPQIHNARAGGQP